MDYKIYKLTSPEGLVYIGLTKQTLTKRWNYGYGYSKNARLFHDICQFGWDNFKHELMETAATKDEGLLIEARLIEEYDSTNPEKGYNSHSNKYTRQRNHITKEKPFCYMCIETGKQYHTQTEIAAELNVSRQWVSRCI
jgi:hypothetical protein